MVSEPGRLLSDELEGVRSAATAGQEQKQLVVRPGCGVEPDVVVCERAVDAIVGRLRCNDVLYEGRRGFRRARHHRPCAKRTRPIVGTGDVLTAGDCERYRSSGERVACDA